ncbi:hypothetical protein NHF48_007480 [Sphingomonas sp. H160509]|uniref:hypothetical protein n=1 Tax=Sphingomonas sp. H160509 TaxID=2955313 RepID=UPI002096DB76|nr:hypothetical protein [Sphingomonas sp. H160509]MDD1450842.1 hypothetical protein [Sphingomonas sp. H160509]
MLSPLTVDVSGDIAISIPGLPVANLEIGANAYPFGQWAILKMSDFATEKEARVAGERLGDILLVAGAVTMTGIDIGFSQTTLQFSQDIHDAVKAVDGKILRAETHGLIVYKENTVKIVGIDARGSALIASDALERRLEMSASLVTGMTDRQRNCAALLNDSFFVPQTEGQFVLRVSAVEALCDQNDVGSEYQSAISKIEAFVEKQDFPSDVKTTINRSLSFQKEAVTAAILYVEISTFAFRKRR